MPFSNTQPYIIGRFYLCEVNVVAVSTNSLGFPQMFDVVRGKVTTLEDTESIVNRTRLLMLTSPTELYNEPDFGVGMPRYLWQYNSPNIKPLIRDRVAEQLEMYEPYCIPDETKYADGLVVTGAGSATNESPNVLNMSIILSTRLGTTTNIDTTDLQQSIELNESLLDK